jgi:N-acetylmuramoyl-L-alanine amidase
MFQTARLYAELYAYSKSPDDLDRALELYGRMADTYPGHRLADDAQYAVGEIYYIEKKDLSRACIEFLKVDVRFPKGDMRPKARVRLEELQTALNRKNGTEAAPVSRKEGVQASGKESATASAEVPSDLIRLKDVRHWSTPNYTRVVIDMERPAKYQHRLQTADGGQDRTNRLVVEIEGAVVESGIAIRKPDREGLLRHASAEQGGQGRVRVDLEMEGAEEYKVFHLYDPFRIVVDAKRQKDPGAPVQTAEPPPPPSPPSPPPPPSSSSTASGRHVRKGVRKAEEPDGKLSLARQLGLHVKTIVIDPGHGGKDPGCYVDGGLKEKDIVLEIARLAVPRIEKALGCKVYLTRTTDVYLSLEQRTAIANMKKADLFISLHINAHKDSGIWGIETYFLNMATDERAVVLAARENATSEKRISDLQSILNDLMLNTKLKESNRLAHQVQGGMVRQVEKRYASAKSLGVKQAPFYVLVGANMPSILVETGFLTNSREKKRLATQGYREAIADGLCTGIASYIRETEKAYRGGG